MGCPQIFIPSTHETTKQSWLDKELKKAKPDPTPTKVLEIETVQARPLIRQFALDMETFIHEYHADGWGDREMLDIPEEARSCVNYVHDAICDFLFGVEKGYDLSEMGIREHDVKLSCIDAAVRLLMIYDLVSQKIDALRSDADAVVNTEAPLSIEERMNRLEDRLQDLIDRIAE